MVCTCPDPHSLQIRARPCSCLGPNFAPGAHTPPSCACFVQTCPSFAPCCWAPLEPKLEPTGPNSAQVGPKLARVRPNLRQKTAEFDPSRLWLGQVGPLLSSLAYSLRAGGARREATRIKPCQKDLVRNLYTIFCFNCGIP